MLRPKCCKRRQQRHYNFCLHIRIEFAIFIFYALSFSVPSFFAVCFIKINGNRWTGAEQLDLFFHRRFERQTKWMVVFASNAVINVYDFDSYGKKRCVLFGRQEKILNALGTHNLSFSKYHYANWFAEQHIQFYIQFHFESRLGTFSSSHLSTNEILSNCEAINRLVISWFHFFSHSFHVDFSNSCNRRLIRNQRTTSTEHALQPHTITSTTSFELW